MEIIVMSVGAEDKIITLKATCGHEDNFGYFTNTVCAKCAKANHKKAIKK